MENNLVKCPYCGKEIDNNTKICPQCQESFSERTLPVKINSLGLFIILNIFTLGLYQNIWLLQNLSKINDMALSKKDRLKLDVPVILLIVAILFLISQVLSYILYLTGEASSLTVFIAVVMWLISHPIFWVEMLLMYVITYRILRIIEKYTKNQYNITICHSELGWLFAPIISLTYFSPFFYMIYFIYTYTERVYNPKPINV